MANAKPPCVNFQQGNCPFGDICRFSHGDAPEKKTPLCQFFAKGTCRRGDDCQYSHDMRDATGTRSAIDEPQHNAKNGPNPYDQFIEWRHDIKQNKRDIKRAQPLGKRMSQFIQNALFLIEIDDTMQEIIKCLSSEGGIERLGELLNANFSAMADDRLLVVFKDQLLPLMQILSHHNVLSSAILESRHATLLNYLFGINGKRSVAVFGAIIRALTYQEKISSNIDPCLITLSAVLEVNGSAQVNEDLRSAAETMLALADERIFSGNALKYHRKMCLRLGLGDHIKQAVNNKQPVAARSKATFELSVDLPGELSENGPRHDNDFHDIEDIQILPTMEEILSERAEYLPQTDPSTWHFQGVAGLLDRQFRLLREDTVGQLRDAAKVELARIQNQHNQNRPPRYTGPRTYSYQNVRLIGVEFDQHKGLLCVLRITQPREVSGKSEAKRKEWWDESNRLDSDALIMLLGSDQIAIFLTVASSVLSVTSQAGQSKVTSSLEKRYPRHGDEEFAHVIVQLVDRNESDTEALLFRFGMGSEKLSFSLLEFPGVLLPAFYPTLAAIQRMDESSDLPFAELLAPVTIDAEGQDAQQCRNVDPPAYAKRHGFRFDLSTLSTTNESIQLDVNDPLDADTLSGQTNLDNAQADALISSLCKSIALIQGPPGTGKSYTGVALLEVLLANKKAARLGPIVVVTFSNHALDAVLERAVDAGVKQIIRIGSRSKSERLANVNLRIVAQKEELTKLEKKERWEIKHEIDKHGSLIKECLNGLKDACSEGSVMNFLKEEYPAYHAQLVEPEIDDDGFELVRGRRAPQGIMAWIQGNVHATQASRDAGNDDLFKLNIVQREELYKSWTEEIMEPMRRSLLANLDAYENAKKQLDRIRAEVDLRVLNRADVIGVTTSGLARSLDLVRRLQSKVLIKEEAGEIMEAQSLTVILPSIEHMILIGDHQQLRPKAQNYELSAENPRSQIKLDVSLFERLVNPEYEQYAAIPYTTLNVQRRMHPSISQLIRPTLYPNLQDSPQVNNYPEVSGMRRRLFWLNHGQPEDGEQDRSDSTSHTNQYEVDMVFALVRHLVRQGVYKATDIAVLTPYLAQLRKLRRALRSFAEVVINDRDIDDLAREDDGSDDVGDAGAHVKDKPNPRLPPTSGVHKSTLLQALRLATIDNFQGEEAKVVVISLVRCNQQRRCGFLRTSNRINVLLSRAQHGMYITGNTDTSCHVPMWGQVLEMLEKGNNVGAQLELCCPRHPKTPLAITTPDDFSSVSPEAGCDLLCGQRLLCGHSCVNKCHSEGLHKTVYCLKPCNRVKQGCNHNCQYECGRECDEKCMINVPNIDVELPCGHRVQQLPCWEYQDPTQVKCQTLVERTIPGCEHKVRLPCYRDVNAPSFFCTAVCGSLLPCGHACKAKCFRCRYREGNQIVKEVHDNCQQPCGRDFTNCKHSCTAPCHGAEDCPLCDQPCDVQCSHTRCTKKCSEPCTPCAEEKCASCCPHAECKMPCAAPCDWVPCSQRCVELLPCGHQCPSICGADCPSEEYCQICASEDIKDLRADLIMLTTYGEVDLAESPCMFLPCGHIFTVESLDGVMDMSEHYKLDGMTGMPTALSGTSKPFSYDEIKMCPDCRGSLRLVSRYGRIVRRALLDESTKKFITWSNREYMELAETMKAIQERLLETRSDVVLHAGHIALTSQNSHVRTLGRLAGLHGRYRPMLALRRKLEAFLHQTAASEQPLGRVHEIVEALRRRRVEDGHGANAFEFDEVTLQTRGSLLATALLIRCEVIASSDFISIFDAQPQQSQNRTLKNDFSRDRDLCETLIESATKASAPLQEAEGHVFWAHLAALECNTMEARERSTDNILEDLKVVAEEHLDRARELCTTYPGQTSNVEAEVGDVRRLLREGGYHSQMRMVVAAMQAGFSGTGHWYRCENGHPFTVGECGMPMEESRCPQCNAPIGGSEHEPAAGVQHADDIEEEFANMRIRD